jgi:hypothetical protein
MIGFIFDTVHYLNFCQDHNFKKFHETDNAKTITTRKILRNFYFKFISSLHKIAKTGNKRRCSDREDTAIFQFLMIGFIFDTVHCVYFCQDRNFKKFHESDNAKTITTLKILRNFYFSFIS